MKHNVTIQAGVGQNSVGGFINLTAGLINDFDGTHAARIILDSNHVGGVGGNVNIYPGTGTPDGIVLVNGSLIVSNHFVNATGLVFNAQSTTPFIAFSGNGTIWAKNDDTSSLMYTDGYGLDHKLLSNTIVWRTDGTGDATTWTEVFAQIKDRAPYSNVEVIMNGDEDLVVDPPAEYDVQGARFIFIPDGSVTPDSGILEIQDGAVLRNPRGFHGAGIVSGFGSTDPCLIFDPDTGGRASFELSDGVQITNNNPSIPLCQLDNTVQVSWTIRNGASVSGGCLFNLTGTDLNMFAYQGVGGTNLFVNGYVKSDASSSININHDGSYFSKNAVHCFPDSGTGFAGTVFNLPTGIDGGFGPTVNRPDVGGRTSILYANKTTGHLELYEGSVWNNVLGSGALLGVSDDRMIDGSSFQDINSTSNGFLFKDADNSTILECTFSSWNAGDVLRVTGSSAVVNSIGDAIFQIAFSLDNWATQTVIGYLTDAGSRINPSGFQYFSNFTLYGSIALPSVPKVRISYTNGSADTFSVGGSTLSCERLNALFVQQTTDSL